MKEKHFMERSGGSNCFMENNTVVSGIWNLYLQRKVFNVEEEKRERAEMEQAEDEVTTREVQ